MSRIRSQNTKAELLVFAYLRKRKIYFQKHYSKVPGKPDIALPRRKIAVFIDGDFWHGWKFKEKQSKLPALYWQEKIAGNIARDKRNRAKLKKQGWRVLRVWEHQLKKNPDVALQKIERFLNS